MAVWLVRAGKSGEYEEKFLNDHRVYATWHGLRRDLGALADKRQLQGVLHEFYPDWGSKRVINYASQLWPFAKEMKPGDLVVTPRKRKAAIAVGEIKGDYKFDDKADDPYFHSRTVKWLAPEVPRSVFDQDLLFSFGAFMTICEIQRNDAEGRLRAMARSGWKGEGIASAAGLAVSEEDTDLEELARGQIAKLISRKFRGHDLERLVEALLQAQGYTTYRSPVGADKGVDILAAPGPLGFGSPRICVQVKSSSSPIEHAILNQLKGAMQTVQAQQGLLVSWGGFRSSIDKDLPNHFFQVRLWNQDDLIDQLLEHYDKLDAGIRAELPLKRMWAVAVETEDEE